MEPLRGNAVVGQSGGPTAVVNATLSGVIRGVWDEQAGAGRVGRLYGMRYGVEGLLRGETVPLYRLFARDGDGALSDLDALVQTPGAALGSCRCRLPETDSPDGRAAMERLFSVLDALDVRFFLYIGGNDSMDTVVKVAAYAERIGFPLRAVGIPKTIDNDLCGTDHTPGYGSAAKYVAVTMREILRDTAAYDVPAVTIVEIMGRGSGWLAASSALGRLIDGQEPDAVYLPERPFSLEGFLADLRLALARRPNAVVAVSEGIRFADGSYVGASAQSGAADAFGHRYLSGAARVLEHVVRQKLGCKVRSVELNLPQRCAAHLVSAQDAEEALLVGQSAVAAALAGANGEMMAIERAGDDPYAFRVRRADARDVANRVRTVPDRFITHQGNHVTDECLAYILPLIRGERFPVYENGLPRQWAPDLGRAPSR